MRSSSFLLQLFFKEEFFLILINASNFVSFVWVWILINDCYSKINKHICSNSSHAINDKSINLLVISSVFFQFFFFCSYSLFVLFLHIFFLQVAFYEIFITSPYKKWKTNRWLWIVFFFFPASELFKKQNKKLSVYTYMRSFLFLSAVVSSFVCCWPQLWKCAR